MKKLFVLGALLSLTVAALAQNPIGTWKGKVKIDPTSLPKATSPQQQAAIDNAMKQVAGVVITLVLKPNKTFTISAPGMNGEPPHSSTGVWTQKGNLVTITPKTADGKEAKNAKPQSIVIAKDGKTMTMTPTQGAANSVQVIFSK